MKLEAIYHRPKLNWSYMYDEDTVHIRLRTKRNNIDSVNVMAGDKYEFQATLTAIPMRILASDALFDYWEAAVTTKNWRLQYYFQLKKGSKQIYMDETEFSRKPPQNAIGIFEFPYLHANDMLKPPQWVKDAVFYQIFLDRFANGDKSNDPASTERWGGKPQQDNYFGGDLQGVIDHLDHLSSLGVNAIYFNPIFQAMTNHKYDTQDYMSIDQQFGTNELMKVFVDACHARGIRVLLDAVFNHSGKTFAPFVDVLKKGEASIYKDWFHVEEFPLQVKNGKPTYRAFAFEPHMPKLNTQNPEVKLYLLDVARYWMEEIGIDGWRIDVANEVDHQFFRDFRQVVKQVDEQAYILGEIWHDSMMWLQGDQFDAVMNYPFTNAVLDFFAHRKINAEQFSNRISYQLSAYPLTVNEVAFNLLDSHDTPRLLTLCKENKSIMKLAALFQLTFLGAPCIYYGDEIGLTGGADPDCRKCMEWEKPKQDQDLFAFYQEMISLRKGHEALRTGAFRFKHARKGDNVIVYERTNDSECFIIMMNNSHKPGIVSVQLERGQWSNPLSSDIMTVTGEAVQIDLPAYGYAIWKQ